MSSQRRKLRLFFLLHLMVEGLDLGGHSYYIRLLIVLIMSSALLRRYSISCPFSVVFLLLLLSWLPLLFS